MYCVYCGSNDVMELTIERGEEWIFCYQCKQAFNPLHIPEDVFIRELEDQGFPKDAEKLRNGERASECGE